MRVKKGFTPALLNAVLPSPISPSCRPLPAFRDLGARRLHKTKARPDGGRVIETVAHWRTIPMRTYDLTPFYRSTVGFDRLFSLLDQVNSDGGNGYPPYNIERTGENAYRISVAVSGFAKEELSIVAKENTLTIKGEKAGGENGKDKAEV